MTSVKIRNYKKRDLIGIGEILSHLASPTGKTYDAETMISEALDEEPSGVFVAAATGKVSGFAIVLFKDWFQIAYLDFIAIAQELYGKGIGRLLLEKCVKWAKSKKARIIYTETGSDNLDGIAFFRGCGFIPTGHIPDFYRDGLDAVILVRKL